eukprot:m.436817 g.436817  ORF g.436817 m.436817 type:complete len:71 (+) comp56778_c1_seq3:1771-1983(+)
MELTLRYFEAFCKPIFQALSLNHCYTVAEGVIQGDPLSPLFFALGLHISTMSLLWLLQHSSNKHFFASRN